MPERSSLRLLQLCTGFTLAKPWEQCSPTSLWSTVSGTSDFRAIKAGQQPCSGPHATSQWGAHRESEGPLEGQRTVCPCRQYCGQQTGATDSPAKQVSLVGSAVAQDPPLPFPFLTVFPSPRENFLYLRDCRQGPASLSPEADRWLTSGSAAEPLLSANLEQGDQLSRNGWIPVFWREAISVALLPPSHPQQVPRVSACFRAGVSTESGYFLIQSFLLRARIVFCGL